MIRQINARIVKMALERIHICQQLTEGLFIFSYYIVHFSYYILHVSHYILSVFNVIDHNFM